ncbi:MAG: hypothetical protein RR512_07560 [Coprobacillus sp.]
MKKSSFITLLLSVISLLTLGIGMCMCLLPEWNLFNQGVIVGIIGLILSLVTIIVYRKLEHKNPLKISLKVILIVIYAIFALLCLGTGMSLTMVYNSFISGMVIGVIGIILLICLIPMCKGFK